MAWDMTNHQGLMLPISPGGGSKADQISQCGWGRAGERWFHPQFLLVFRQPGHDDEAPLIPSCSDSSFGLHCCGTAYTALMVGCENLCLQKNQDSDSAGLSQCRLLERLCMVFTAPCE